MSIKIDVSGKMCFGIFSNERNFAVSVIYNFPFIIGRGVHSCNFKCSVD
jgi:hypothetical protein